MLRQRFRIVLAIMAVSYVPIVAVDLVPAVLGVSDTNDLFVYAALVVVFLSVPFALGAVTFAVVQESRGESPSVGQALSAAAGRCLPMTGALLLLMLLAALAMVLLIVPGLMVICAFYVAQSVCLAERRGAAESLSRSAALTKGRRWAVFGVLAFVLSVQGVDVLIGYATAAMGLGDTAQSLASYVWLLFADGYANVLTAVLYLHLRSEKEGPDFDGVARVFE